MRSQVALRGAACVGRALNRFQNPTSRPTIASSKPSRQSKLTCKAAQAGAPQGDDSFPRKDEFDLKQAIPPEAAKALQPATSFFSNIIRAYNDALAKHPVQVKALTSLVGFCLGDIIAQSVTGTGAFDIYRCVRLSLYGILIDGPVGHFFYKFIDTNVGVDNPKGTKAVLTKTAIDQLLWAPAMTVVFLAFLTTLEGRPEAIMGVVSAKLLPIYLANLSIWPLWHLINFRYVPPEQRILFNNIVAVAWTTYLSFTCGSLGGGAGTPRDVLAAGLPCAVTGISTLLSESHHIADAVRQTSAVDQMLTGWGADAALPNAEAGAELLVNYASMKAEVVKTVCNMPQSSSMH